MKLDQRCKRIELVVSDVDGVLTDGGIVFDNQGIEIKRFHIRDGLGIKLWQRTGRKFALLTARNSHIVQVRAAEIGIDVVRQGFEEKLPVALEMFEQLGCAPEQVCYIGDDLTDLAVVQSVGLGVTVADGVDELKQHAAYTTKLSGGQGAVREVLELILKAQGRWQDLIETYLRH